MKKSMRIFIAIVLSLLMAPMCNGALNDLDLLILKDPAGELREAIQSGSLEKMIRVVSLIEEGKIPLDIFKDPALVKHAVQLEEKNKQRSKLLLTFKGLLWTALIGVSIMPAGLPRVSALDAHYSMLDDSSSVPVRWLTREGRDPSYLYAKGTGLALISVFLMVLYQGSSSVKKQRTLIYELTKMYHQKSLVN